MQKTINTAPKSKKVVFFALDSACHDCTGSIDNILGRFKQSKALLDYTIFSDPNCLLAVTVTLTFSDEATQEVIEEIREAAGLEKHLNELSLPSITVDLLRAFILFLVIVALFVFMLTPLPFIMGSSFMTPVLIGLGLGVVILALMCWIIHLNPIRFNKSTLFTKKLSMDKILFISAGLPVIYAMLMLLLGLIPVMAIGPFLIIGAMVLFVSQILAIIKTSVLKYLYQSTCQALTDAFKTSYLWVWHGAQQQWVKKEAHQLREGDIYQISSNTRIPVNSTLIQAPDPQIQSSLICKIQEANKGEVHPIRVEADKRLEAGNIIQSENKQAIICLKAEQSYAASSVIGTQAGLQFVYQRKIREEQTYLSPKGTVTFSYYFLRWGGILAIITLILWLLINPVAWVQACGYFFSVLSVACCPCAIMLAELLGTVMALQACRLKGIHCSQPSTFNKIEAFFKKPSTFFLDKTGTLTEDKLSVKTFHLFDEVLRALPLPLINALLPCIQAMEDTYPNGYSQAISDYIRSLKQDEVVETLLPKIETTLDPKLRGLIGRFTMKSHSKPQKEHTLMIGSLALFEEHKIIGLSEKQTLFCKSRAQEGDTLIFVGLNKSLIGYFLITNQLRPDAKRLVEALKIQTHRLGLLTGDHIDAAQYVARQLGIGVESVYAGQTPDKKVKVIQNEKKKDTSGVALVCDGYNDIEPAGVSDLSIAVTDSAVTKTCADVTVSSLVDILSLPAIIKVKNKIVRQSMVLLLVYNGLVVIGLVASGLAQITLFPGIGSLMMLLSFILVIIHSARLLYMIPGLIQNERDLLVTQSPHSILVKDDHQRIKSQSMQNTSQNFPPQTITEAVFNKGLVFNGSI